MMSASKPFIKALLAEDEKTLASLLQEVLLKRGIALSLAYDGLIAYETYQDERPDVVIVDVMMPKLDGYSLVRKIRQKDSLIPIIFLTARGEEEDVLEGFEAGADDYLRKPFKTSELIARIKALTRRSAFSADEERDISESNVLSIGRFLYDHTMLRLRYIDAKGRIEDQNLSYREGEILYRLIHDQDRIVFSRSILCDLWGREDYYTNRSLHVFITRLRHYLSADDTICITNIRSVGYKLIIQR